MSTGSTDGVPAAGGRSRRRVASIAAIGVFAAFLATVSSTSAPAGAVAGFGDVADGAFYAEPVQWMVDNEITTGTSPGCFSPDRDVSRAEVAVFLHRYDGEPVGGTEPFTDVPSDSWYTEAVAWMVANEITTGTSATTFSPARSVTRGEVAALMWRFVGQPAGGAEPFVDVAPGRFYTTAVAWMVANGITTGTSATTFSPDRPVTRGELATFMYRLAGEPTVTLDPGGTCGSSGGSGSGGTGGSGGSGNDDGSGNDGSGGSDGSGNDGSGGSGGVAPDRFETLGVGAALPSGADCAGWVKDAPEIRPGNADENATRGTENHPVYPRVDGDFTGTTDEILQWVACKWGFDEDIVRAQAAAESWWHMSAQGDATGRACHWSVAHLSPCPESLGIMQVRFPYHGDAFDGAAFSTAYNVDYTYAVMRDCFEGGSGWLNDVERGRDYAAGDLMGCLGTWFSGRWYTADAIWYIDEVETIRDERWWEETWFINDPG